MRDMAQSISETTLDFLTVSYRGEVVTIHPQMSLAEFRNARLRVDDMLLQVATARADHEVRRR